MSELNDNLLKAQSEWAKKCYNQLKEEFDKDNYGKERLSRAFSFGVTDHYVNADKKIMVVGQEARGHDEHGELENWQKWAISYLDRQVYKEKNGNYYNGSPFWRFFRTLEKEGFAPCWNNIDKVRKYVCSDGIKWSEHKLSFDDKINCREILNAKIFDGKSLLQKEIELATPNAVVFIIGPNNPYYHALGLAFFDGEEVDKKLADVYPKCNEADCCREISSLLGLNIPAYYTYHPNFLNRNKLFNKVIEKVTANKI